MSFELLKQYGDFLGTDFDSVSPVAAALQLHQ